MLPRTLSHKRVNLFRMLSSKLPQIVILSGAPHRFIVTRRLWRGVEEPVPNVAEGTSTMVNLPMLLRAFQPPSPHRAARYGFSRIPPLVHALKLFHPGTSTSRRKPSYEISKGFPLVRRGFRSLWATAGLETEVFHSLHRHPLHANSPSGSKK